MRVAGTAPGAQPATAPTHGVPWPGKLGAIAGGAPRIGTYGFTSASMSRCATFTMPPTSARYATGSETFALKRSEVLRIDWGVECYRQWDEAFSVLNLA